MPSKTLVAALVVTALTVAACGSSGSVASNVASSGSHGRPTAIYRVLLSGQAETQPGALQGRGDAIVAFHGESVVCWRFAHLHGFTGATDAQIHAGPTGRVGSVILALSTGPRLHHQGCVSLSPGLSKLIMGNPSGYYVNIPSVQYPAGAVRAQL